MDPGCCFSGTTPLVSGFLGVVVCKKSFGLYTWQPNKRQRGPCFVLCRELHFLLSGQEVPKGAARSLRRDWGSYLISLCLSGHRWDCLSASVLWGGIKSSGEIASQSNTHCSTVASLLLQLCWCHGEQWLTVWWGERRVNARLTECTSPATTFLNTALTPLHGFAPASVFLC